MFRFFVLPCFVFVLPVLIHSSYGLISAVDSSSAVTQASFAAKLNAGFTRAIIRGYDPACTVGGRVNPDFATAYRNAVGAGYTDIQTYWLPCNGHGSICSGYDDQLLQLLLEVYIHVMGKIQMIWLDLEQDPDCEHNWNYGVSGNIAQAQALLAILKKYNCTFGIYSTAGEWTKLFGSTSFVLNSSVPLWVGNSNGKKSVTLDTPFGGWTTAVGHQYFASTTATFDESVFSS